MDTNAASGLDFGSVLSDDVHDVVQTYADKLGVPFDYIFFPLLSLVRSALGKVNIEVNDLWDDPGCLWTCIIGCHGSRRTASLNNVINKVSKSSPLERDIDLWNDNTVMSFPSAMKMSRKLLHAVSDDLVKSVFEANEICERKLRSGYDDGLLNITGFATANEVKNLCTDINILPRLLLSHPQPFRPKQPTTNTKILVSSKDIVQAIYDFCNSRKGGNHEIHRFCLDSDAKNELSNFCKDMVNRADAMASGTVTDDLIFSMFSKAPGQVIRVGLALSVLSQGVGFCNGRLEDKWSFEITAQVIKAATSIVKHSLTQKLLLIKRAVEKTKVRVPMTSPVSMQVSPSTSKPDSVISGSKQILCTSNISRTRSLTGSESQDESPAKRPRNDTSQTSSERKAQNSASGSFPSPGSINIIPALQVAPNTAPMMMNNIHPMQTSNAAQQFQQQMNTMAHTQSQVQLQAQVMQVQTQQAIQAQAMQAQVQQAQLQQQMQQMQQAQKQAQVLVPQGQVPAPISVQPKPDEQVQQKKDKLSPTSNSRANKPGHSLTPEGVPRASTILVPEYPLEGLNPATKQIESLDAESQLFLRRYSQKIKRLLEHQLEWRLTPSLCAQRHLMPPLSKQEMYQLNTMTKYPAIVAKEYLTRIAKLGFGTIETTHSKMNNRRSILFIKHTIDQLPDSARAILEYLEVTPEAYMGVFTGQQAQALASLEMMKNGAQGSSDHSQVSTEEEDDKVTLVEPIKVEPVDCII